MTPHNKVVSMPKPGGMKAFMLYIDDWLSSWQVKAMDNDERNGYMMLLMKAASDPECCIPDNDWELAVISELGQRWWKPGRDKNKRKATQVQQPDGSFKVVYKTTGEKIRECFQAFPISGQCGEKRLYNERLYEEFERHQRVRNERSSAGRLGAAENEGRRKGSKSFFTPPVLDNNTPANVQQTAPQPTTYNLTESSIEKSLCVPPPTYQQVEAVHNIPEIQPQPQKTLTETEFEQFTKHCEKLGLRPAGRDLANRTRSKFPDLELTEALVLIPRFQDSRGNPTQTSPGLWDSYTGEQLMAESVRQSTVMVRKPIAKTSLDMAFERLRQKQK